MSQPGIAIESPPEESAAGFGDRVRSAVIWRWGSQVAAQLITWTTTIMIVRLLEPRDYGLFAMTQAVLTALNFLNCYSFASSLIHPKEIDERRIGQVFGLLIIANALLAATQVLLAPVAADYYHQPLVADLLRVQALIYLTTPFIALPASLLARGLNFRTQALVNLICAVVGSIVGLWLAWLGYGVWALVWAPLAMFATRALGLTIAAGRLARPIFDFRGGRDVLGFGTALTLCQLFWIIQSQSDIFIAGHSFTPHDLGLYSESLFLVLIFTGRFLPPLNEVAFPAYAELHNSGRPIGPAFVASIRMMMLIAAPFYVGLSLAAGPLVETFFGPKWLEIIPIVAGLAIAMPAMALQIACSPATNALGRPWLYVVTNACGAIIMPAAFLYGVAAGPHGLVLAWQVAAPLLLVATLAATLPAIRVSLLDLGAALLPCAAGCGVMALAVSVLGSQLHGLPAPAQLVILAGAGAAVYGGALWLGWPELVRETWAMLRRPRGSAPAPGEHETAA